MAACQANRHRSLALLVSFYNKSISSSCWWLVLITQHRMRQRVKREATKQCHQ